MNSAFCAANNIPKTSMKKLPLIAAFAAAAGSAYAQNPRASVQLDTSVAGAQAPAVVCDGDTSAVFFKDSTDNTVWVSNSDGRGIDWSAPVRIDDDALNANKFVYSHGFVATGGNTYAVWRDERNSADDDLYFAANNGGGWGANIMLDKGYPAGANPVRNYAIAAEGLNIAVLISPDNGNEDLYLVTSTDGGATFSAAMSVTAHNGAADVDTIDIAMDNGVAHIAWIDNFAGGDGAWYSAYDFAGAAFTSMDVAISANANALGGDVDDPVQISADNGVVAVCFQNRIVSGANETYANVMLGGAWNGDALVGNFTAGVDDCDNNDILVNGNNVIVAWEDNRTGGDEVYVASADTSAGGVVFGADVLASIGGSGYPRLTGGGDYVACLSGFGVFPNISGAAVSTDGGMTFGAPFTYSDTIGDVDYVEGAFNSMYGNFISAWLSDDSGVNNCYVGGFRNQTATAVGTFSAGNLVHFDASGFGASEDGNLFAILLSGAPGSYLLPYGDGRETGLTQDAFMAYSLGQIPGLMSGALAGGGGSTPDVVMPNLAPGTMIYFVGVGFDASANLYSVTDVNSVTTL